MQAQSRSRKRAAPGTSPSVQQQQDASVQQPFQYASVPIQDASFSNDSLANYRNTLGNEPVNSYDGFDTLDPNFYNTSLNAAQPPTFGANLATPIPPHPSNQLVRRDTNQQLATRTPQRNQWSTFNNGGGGSSSGNSNQRLSENRVWENMEEEEEPDIDTKAAIAKKDAQAKRKQIPPFVQKLSSFLDSSNNTELIRWSDDGNSFIVLDEDEFARTLIPELFKHNNYASFVRQLNMYGFHKKVGLNANSMKAAEKKVKDPNVYWHEYFKRGRPDLLWLIQKPQSKTNAKRKRGDDKRDQGDSDDDIRRTSPEIAETSNVTRTRPGQVDMVSIPQSDMHNVRSELQRLQRQQGVISKMIGQLKEQNEQFYRQATAFQALHDRHENSINAILTFLATFYNRSLDGNNPQNLVNMFQNSIPQTTQQHGSVVDVGDLPEVNIDNNQQLQRYPKRPLALLPPPLAGSTPSPNPASARSSNSPALPQQRRGPMQSTPVPQQQQHQHQQQQQQAQRSSATPQIKDDAETPNYLGQLPENDDMISLLNNVNASNSASPNPPGGSNFDFSSALDHFQTANGASPLTQQQRDSMLSLIAQQGQPSTSQPGANNALVAPTPPPMPSLDQLQRTQEQLDMLTRLQQEQDAKVADLAGRLQPLSPSGTIPGMTAADGTDLGNPGDFDINAFINSDDNYFSQFPGGGGVGLSSQGAGGGGGNVDGNDNSDLDFGDLSNVGGPVNWNFDDNDDDNNNNIDNVNVDSSHLLSANANGTTGLGLGGADGHEEDDNNDDNDDDLFGDFGTDEGGTESRDEQRMDGGGRIVGSVTSEETSPQQQPGEEDTDGVEGETPGKKRRLR